MIWGCHHLWKPPWFLYIRLYKHFKISSSSIKLSHSHKWLLESCLIGSLFALAYDPLGSDLTLFEEEQCANKSPEIDFQVHCSASLNATWISICKAFPPHKQPLCHDVWGCLGENVGEAGQPAMVFYNVHANWSKSLRGHHRTMEPTVFPPVSS